MALAAAVAENGDLTRAVQLVDQAKPLPEAPFSEAGMSELQKTFQSGKPYRDGMRTLLMMPDDATEKAAASKTRN